MGQRQFHIASFAFACILFLLSTGRAQDTYDEKHIEVSLRMIGHQLLLTAGDSTSRVLPIIRSENRYSIQFESEFAFLPDDLIATVNRVVKETDMAKAYIVEMETCETGEVIYTYQVYEEEKWNTIPCKGRAQPKSCYRLSLTLNNTEATAVASLPTIADPSVGLPPETSPVNYVAIALLFVLIAMGTGLFFLWKRKRTPMIDPNLIPLGGYYFDKHTTELLIENERIKLTSKEADLLLLLYNAVNTTIERDVILNKVWGDEGAYVGRTLDVFISKLRKKLDADSRVKIVNIRGVGYKLVIAA